MATATLQTSQPSLNQEMRAAAAVASVAGSNRARKIRLLDSDLPSLVPEGSTLEVAPAKFTDLKMGDIICVQMGHRLALRRFVKSKIAKKDTYLLTAREGFSKKEALPRTSLLGKVNKVTAGSESFDPGKAEGFLQQFWGKLTEYGTHKPFGFIKAS